MRKVVLDLETFDPTLKTTGTDAHTRKASGFVFLAGLYLPIEGRMWLSNWQETGLKHQIREFLDEGCYWYVANGKYDLNWLLSEEVFLPRHSHNNFFDDNLINAPLIDETQPYSFYSLDGQCKHYELPTKPIEELLAAAKRVGIKTTEKDVRSQLWEIYNRGERQVIEEYLRHDLVSTWEVAKRQEPLIKENGLARVHELESKLIPILAMMENRGVKVSTKQAEYLFEEAYNYIQGISAKLKTENSGKDVPLTTSNALTQFIRDRGHKLPPTPKSTEEKPRFKTDATTIEALAEIDPLMKELVNARRAEKIAKDFAKGAILNNHHNGRIHPNINQIVGSSEDGEGSGKGVRFGRLSYSQPNLQQVPKKDKITLDGVGGLGSAMRRIFIAEDGCQVMSSDFSSQEPRLIIHFAETWEAAIGKKIGKPDMWNARRIADMYRENPAISSHDIVAGGIEGDLQYKQKRDLAKIINLGKGYEMGMNKLIKNLVAGGVPPEQAQQIMDDFDRNFPHVSLASKSAQGAAVQNGYVRTYYGRKLNFNQWEPIYKKKDSKGRDIYEPARTWEDAHNFWELGQRRPIMRAFTYRAFNRVIQGSAADQTKAAMVSLWYDHGILPYLQVHDELVDATITSIDTVRTYKEVMENVMPLTIPSLTEVKVGKDWKSGVLTHISPEYSKLRV